MKRLYFKLNEQTNQNSIKVTKVIKPWIRKRYYEALGTSVNKQPKFPSLPGNDYTSLFVQGTWGGGKDHNDSVKGGKGRTITCKLPKQMLPVVVGEDGKVAADIARFVFIIMNCGQLCPPFQYNSSYNIRSFVQIYYTFQEYF